MSLYDFHKGHAFLDSLGVPRLNHYQNNVVIKQKEFAEEEANGEIDWREDGVYLKVNGIYQRGYLYNKRHNVHYKGEFKGMPRFHLVNCETLESYKVGGELNKKFYWSNAAVVTVIEKWGGKHYEDQVLKLCGNCSNLISEEVKVSAPDTDTAFKQEEAPAPTVELDIEGRPMNWLAISKKYRAKMNYTCEKCSFGKEDLQQSRDRRFIETDHIIAHELTNTAESNLQCLCTLCHVYKDELHKSNLSRPHILQKVKNFVSIYHEILGKKNPEKLKQFIKDHLS